jgi:hypothetical protein
MVRTDGMPDFVILGAQKSASTFLQDQMDQHPGIEIAAGESRHFEDPDYSNGGVAELPKLFSSRSPDIKRGIKRPDYLGLPEIPERLADYLPDAQLMVVLRDPLSRAVSSYYHYVRHGFVPLMPLDSAFAQLLDGSLQARFPRAQDVLSYGLYGMHITRYLQYFDRSQLAVFDQGQLIADPGSSVRRAFEFVRVDPAFRPDLDHVSNKGVYSHLRLRLLRSKNHFQFRYTPDLRRRYPKQVSPLGYLWSGSVVTVDRQLLARLDHSRAPKLSEAVAGRLRDFYAADAAVLRTLLAGEGPFPWLG